MCGIVGFTGTKQAAPILLDGLSKLEYRGYDSAGIAVRDGEKDTEIIKEKGKLKVLAEMTNQGKAVKGTCGIGHSVCTRASKVSGEIFAGSEICRTCRTVARLMPSCAATAFWLIPSSFSSWILAYISIPFISLYRLFHGFPLLYHSIP